MASAGLTALRQRLARISDAQLEALLLNASVPDLARSEVEAEARRRAAPHNPLDGAWDVLTRSPAGTPPSLDRDEMIPVEVPRIRHPLARLRALEASTGHPPTTELRPPRLGAPQPPMRRAPQVKVWGSGLILGVSEVAELRHALSLLR